jgi:hypothetical protein
MKSYLNNANKSSLNIVNFFCLQFQVSITPIMLHGDDRAHNTRGLLRLLISQDGPFWYRRFTDQSVRRQCKYSRPTNVCERRDGPPRATSVQQTRDPHHIVHPGGLIGGRVTQCLRLRLRTSISSKDAPCCNVAPQLLSDSSAPNALTTASACSRVMAPSRRFW